LEDRKPIKIKKDHLPDLLRAMFDVGYFPPNTPPPPE
jgi:hypothetical protein